MEKEILEIVEKELPKHVGDTLRKQLDRLDLLEKENKTLKESEKSKKANIESLNKDIEALKRVVREAGDLKEREEKVSEAERNQKIQILEIKLSESEKRTDELKGVLHTVFSSPIYRKSVTESYNRFDQYDQATGKYKRELVSKTTDETTTES